MGADFKLARGFNEFSQSLQTIDCAVAGAVGGKQFEAVVQNATLANDGYLYIQIDTDDTLTTVIDTISFGLYRGTTDKGYFTLVEAPTLTTGDAAIAAECLNRIKDTAPAGALFSNPTGISGGTTVVMLPVYGTRGVDKAVETRVVLKKDTTYVFAFQNKSGGAADAYLRLEYCEV